MARANITREQYEALLDVILAMSSLPAIDQNWGAVSEIARMLDEGRDHAPQMLAHFRDMVFTARRFHDEAELQNLNAQNPAAQNPVAQNPAAQNPNAQNPAAQNPDAQNPDAQ